MLHTPAVYYAIIVTYILQIMGCVLVLQGIIYLYIYIEL